MRAALLPGMIARRQPGDFGQLGRERGCCALWAVQCPQVLGLAVDALIAGALRVGGLVEGASAIEQGALQAAFLPVGVFDTAWAFGKLGMLAGLSRAGGKEGKTRGLPALQAGSTLHPGRGGP